MQMWRNSLRVRQILIYCCVTPDMPTYSPNRCPVHLLDRSSLVLCVEAGFHCGCRMLLRSCIPRRSMPDTLIGVVVIVMSVILNICYGGHPIRGHLSTFTNQTRQNPESSFCTGIQFGDSVACEPAEKIFSACTRPGPTKQGAE